MRDYVSAKSLEVASQDEVVGGEQVPKESTWKETWRERGLSNFALRPEEKFWWLRVGRGRKLGLPNGNDVKVATFCGETVNIVMVVVRGKQCSGFFSQAVGVSW